MKTEIFNYNGNNITFQIGNGDVMVNATEMAKNFGKNPKDYLRTQSAQEFINSLSAVRHISLSQLVVVQKGNSKEFEQGTWMHEDIALDFAQWLSVEFKIWCNDRVKEVLKHGFTATDAKIEELLSNPDLIISLASELKKERQEKALLQIENNKLKPRSEFVDKVFESDNLITMSQTAKILKLPYGRNSLLKKLRETGVFFKNSNEPKQQYVEKGYFVVKEKIQERENHPPIVFMQTFPTQKGLAFIAKILGVVTIPDNRSKFLSV